jgi:hypothetical protein
METEREKRDRIKPTSRIAEKIRFFENLGRSITGRTTGKGKK